KRLERMVRNHGNLVLGGPFLFNKRGRIMNKSNVLFGLGLVLGLLAPAPARAELLPPSQAFAGRTQAEWSAVWWQTMLLIPAGQNPQADTTGAFAFLGDVGPVFFLAGSPFTTPFVRSVTVREDQFRSSP